MNWVRTGADNRMRKLEFFDSKTFVYAHPSGLVRVYHGSGICVSMSFDSQEEAMKAIDEAFS